MRKKLTHAQMKKLSALRPAGTVSIAYRCGGDEIPVQLKNTLSLADTSAFVDRVALASFTEDGDYIPEYQELMMSTVSICMPLPRSFPSLTRSMRKSSWPPCWSALRSPCTPSPQRSRQAILNYNE
ncbi:MAG: hypothetical protein KH284_08830 [Clostridiales bacterium]|nr:hypothetical protein [Clostridiales bacterium]